MGKQKKLKIIIKTLVLLNIINYLRIMKALNIISISLATTYGRIKDFGRIRFFMHVLAILMFSTGVCGFDTFIPKQGEVNNAINFERSAQTEVQVTSVYF